MLVRWFNQLHNNFGLPFLLLVISIYWTQGFRGFPWTGISFLIKDELKLSPAASQLLTSTSLIPWSIKPLYGILSDCVYINGARRVPYILLASLLSFLAWISMAIFKISTSSTTIFTALLICHNLGAAMADVVIDAMVAESAQKERGQFAGDLQTLSWFSMAVGGVLGNMSGGIFLKTFQPQLMFAIFSVFPFAQFIACIFLNERRMLSSSKLSNSNSNSFSSRNRDRISNSNSNSKNNCDSNSNTSTSSSSKSKNGSYNHDDFNSSSNGDSNSKNNSNSSSNGYKNRNNRNNIMNIDDSDDNSKNHKIDTYSQLTTMNLELSPFFNSFPKDDLQRSKSGELKQNQVNKETNEHDHDQVKSNQTYFSLDEKEVKSDIESNQQSVSTTLSILDFDSSSQYSFNDSYTSFDELEEDHGHDPLTAFKLLLEIESKEKDEAYLALSNQHFTDSTYTKSPISKPSPSPSPSSFSPCSQSPASFKLNPLENETSELSNDDLSQKWNFDASDSLIDLKTNGSMQSLDDQKLDTAKSFSAVSIYSAEEEGRTRTVLGEEGLRRRKVMDVEDKTDSNMPNDNVSKELKDKKVLLNEIRRVGVSLFQAVKQPSIFRPLLWFMISCATVPSLQTTMFYYQTNHLGLDASVLGNARVIGWLGLMMGTVLYNAYLKHYPLRNIFMFVHILMSLCTLWDIVLVSRFNLKIGLNDTLCILCGSAITDAVNQFKIMPFLILSAQLCPPGIEGTLFSLFMSANNFGYTLSGYLGAYLASFLGISSLSFSNLSLAILIQSSCTLIPILFLFMIPRDVTGIAKDEGQIHEI